ncbi:MAG: hypothetical protein HY033_12840 [Ignavibacteriae bacterium]|nr:hypothetical protein [Ignavibacteria bacterium]MBI3365780.1 hypothetical protein [Ignavibacteriota bacterium]
MMNANLKRYLNITFRSVITLLLFFGSYILNGYLRQEKRWFYATGTSEKAFLNSTWEMSQQEVERANGKLLTNPQYDLSGLGKPETIDFERYKMKSMSDMRLWGIFCKVDYEFFDDKLFEYTIYFTDVHNREYLDSIITSNISKKYGSSESMQGSRHLIERHWNAEKVSIKYWLYEINSDHESESVPPPSPGSDLEKSYSAGIRITYKPMIEQTKALVDEEQKKIF